MSKVTSLRGMFQSCSSCNAADVSAWDTSSVREAVSAFMSVNSSFDPVGLGSWNLSSATNLDSMFAQNQNFNPPLAGLTLGANKFSARGLFFNCAWFEGVGMENWDVSQLEDADNMFLGASMFEGHLGQWDVSSLTTANGMFHNALMYDDDLTAWNTSSLLSTSGMFRNTMFFGFGSGLNAWTVDQVQDTSYMFYNAINFEDNLTNWELDSVTNVAGMFFGTTALNTSLSGWEDFDQVNSCPNFRYLSSVTDVPAPCDTAPLCTVHSHLPSSRPHPLSLFT